MGTEILRPQDSLVERLRVSPAVLPRRKSYSGTPKLSRKPIIRPEPKKRIPQSEPSISKKLSSDDLKSGGNFVMGQVAILKRGESIEMKKRNESLKKNDEDLIAEMIPNQIRTTDLKSFMSPVAVRSDVYAGSAFSLSPSPRSLPLPSFFKKKENLVIFEDSATKDLRRLLRLD